MKINRWWLHIVFVYILLNYNVNTYIDNDELASCGLALELICIKIPYNLQPGVHILNVAFNAFADVNIIGIAILPLITPTHIKPHNYIPPDPYPKTEVDLACKLSKRCVP